MSAKHPKISQTPAEAIAKRKRKYNQREEVMTFVKRLFWLAAMLLLIFGLVFGVVPMSDNAMRPGISAGDLLFYFRRNSGYNDGDVVVWRRGGKTWAGRIVARGGDTVDIDDDGHLAINGNRKIETDIVYQTARYGNRVTYPLTLKAGQFFVLGDYRIGAKDSRYDGPIPQEAIAGKVILVMRGSDL